MCNTCGCGADEVRIDGVAHAHRHAGGTAHGHDHDAGKVSGAQICENGAQPLHHAHAAGLPAARRLRIEQDILAKNDAHAAHNREQLNARGIFALNLVSSPGAGKTALLVKTIRALADRFEICVIEGDQHTSNDAERIRATGARTVQINTGKGCHLDAHMVGHALERLDPPQHGILMIENVGNLVCPAAFDLGEEHKVVVLSVTEGEDKPLKYPDMFRRSSLMLLNKIDLLPYLEFDLELCIANARRTNPQIGVIGVSAVSGEGLSSWFAWIEQGANHAHAAGPKAARAQEVGPAEQQMAFARSPMR